MQTLTADKIGEADAAAARALPTDVKRRFWKAMLKDHKLLGDARKIDNIELGVAAQLVLQCHAEIHVPMAVEDIV